VALWVPSKRVPYLGSDAQGRRLECEDVACFCCVWVRYAESDRRVVHVYMLDGWWLSKIFGYIGVDGKCRIET
jgi:hypothetical protein